MKQITEFTTPGIPVKKHVQRIMRYELRNMRERWEKVEFSCIDYLVRKIMVKEMVTGRNH